MSANILNPAGFCKCLSPFPSFKCKAVSAQSIIKLQELNSRGKYSSISLKMENKKTIIFNQMVNHSAFNIDRRYHEAIRTYNDYNWIRLIENDIVLVIFLLSNLYRDEHAFNLLNQSCMFRICNDFTLIFRIMIRISISVYFGVSLLWFAV